MFKNTPFRRKDWNWLGVMGVLLVVLIVYPFWASDYDLGVVRDALIFGILALSLDFLWGKTGTLNFSQATFFGMGAYGMGIVTLNVDGPFATLGYPAVESYVFRGAL
jgi:branched-chain amino acid transport system permease protein